MTQEHSASLIIQVVISFNTIEYVDFEFFSYHSDRGVGNRCQLTT